MGNRKVREGGLLGTVRESLPPLFFRGAWEPYRLKRGLKVRITDRKSVV